MGVSDAGGDSFGRGEHYDRVSDCALHTWMVARARGVAGRAGHLGVLGAAARSSTVDDRRHRIHYVEAKGTP